MARFLAAFLEGARVEPEFDHEGVNQRVGVTHTPFAVCVVGGRAGSAQDNWRTIRTRPL
jgi:hypothetical protein